MDEQAVVCLDRGLAVLLVYLVGLGPAAVVTLGAIAGYFVGKYLDGELDVEEIRARAQGRSERRTEGYTEGRFQGSVTSRR
ncbi:MAG: hypothetical protein H0V21_05475 [Rubrobacter sp.]|nr:hypothetical protein [Rubrobacter sp.]